jgi:predicted small secreted protein
MKQSLIALALGALALLAAGCNTVHGIGQDVQKAGEVIQDSTKKK